MDINNHEIHGNNKARNLIRNLLTSISISIGDGDRKRDGGIGIETGTVRGMAKKTTYEINSPPKIQSIILDIHRFVVVYSGSDDFLVGHSLNKSRGEEESSQYRVSFRQVSIVI